MVDVESLVYSRIVSEFADNLKTKYSLDESNFSTEGQSNVDAIFPFVYIHLLPSMEQAITLENDKINSALYTVQIDVVDNSDPTKAKRIMEEVIRIMKTMRFQVIAMPEFDYSQTNIYRQTARFRRAIGSDDTI